MPFFGRESREDEEARQPLLPRYHDATSIQRQAHQKLHTYQMLRALSQGFMPSNEQVIANLRTLLASDLLNPPGDDLSDSSLALVHYSRKFLQQLIQLLLHKNDRDQIQDFVWYLKEAQSSVDASDLLARAARAPTPARANAVAVSKSLQTVGSLLLNNSDFRLFLSDLGGLVREVFRDAAFSLSAASREAGRQLDLSEDGQGITNNHRSEDERSQTTPQDLRDQAAEVSSVVVDSAAKVIRDTEDSIASKARGERGDVLASRLKQAVSRLRTKPGYTESVSTLTLLLKRIIAIYARAGTDTIRTIDGGLERNPEIDRALTNFCLLVSSLGDKDRWKSLGVKFQEFVERGREDSGFDDLLRQIGNSVQDMFTDPTFFDRADDSFRDLQEKSRQIAGRSSLWEDIQDLLQALESALRTIPEDGDVSALVETSSQIWGLVTSPHGDTSSDFIADLTHVFVPLLVRSLKYIPVPRLEISSPGVDLLLENLILEPGDVINGTSFLPYRVRVETYNDVEVRKARFRTATAVKTVVRLKIDGLSIRAEEMGFWLRARALFVRLMDQGIASFRLDERGLDIHLEFELGKDRVDKILSLRKVQVSIHKIDWAVRKSRFSFLSWALKPLIRPILRRAIEAQLSSAIADALRFTNRELVFARERLRAARISNPGDLGTFVKAVLARFVPPSNPDIQTRVGVDHSGRGVFQGIYTPASVVKIWHEEAARAPSRIREYERGGWRNGIFDIPAAVSV
ncbi:hypothetical protein GQ53DRAFT_86 [Thozetella sp. PMI_491]|nr:hypothetical protein GQ53DRAFT_86 [Thozetella sp. PMI_491]